MRFQKFISSGWAMPVLIAIFVLMCALICIRILSIQTPSDSLPDEPHPETGDRTPEDILIPPIRVPDNPGPEQSPTPFDVTTITRPAFPYVEDIVVEEGHK